MKQQCTEKQFLKRVEDHSINIIKDDGIDRRIRFSNNGSNIDHFDLITWPGHLLITGDMGSYLFKRVKDMFTFFRCDKDDLYINPMYWSKKVLAVDRTTGIKEWHSESFMEEIKESVNQYCYDHPEVDEEELKQRAMYEIGNHSESEDCAIRAAMDFSFDGHNPFYGYWERDCSIYTYRFLWNLYAIVWGIQQYDKVKNPNVKVFNMDDTVWWVAETRQEAIEDFKESDWHIDEMDILAEEVSSVGMESLDFVRDPNDKSSKIPFRKRLEEMVQDPEISFPCFFATTEY